MSPRVPAVLLALLVVVLLLGKRSATSANPPQTAAVAVAPPASATPTRRLPRVQQLPGVSDVTAGTPSIDRESRLAVRRRIAREGDRVYFDSLLAHTDSTVVRWRDRGDRLLRVHFVADSTVRGWSANALSDALEGMSRWRNNAANITLERTDDPERADITVLFVSAVIADSTYGVTDLTWDGDGAARRATIRLALQRTDSGPPLPRDVRIRVAAHEFGHALGLAHSGNSRDLMFQAARIDLPSRRDQATLQLLYAVPPGPLRMP